MKNVASPGIRHVTNSVVSFLPNYSNSFKFHDSVLFSLKPLTHMDTVLLQKLCPNVSAQKTIVPVCARKSGHNFFSEKCADTFCFCNRWLCRYSELCPLVTVCFLSVTVFYLFVPGIFWPFETDGFGTNVHHDQ